MHLKEIGYQANFADMDDFTMNCFLVVASTMSKCRDEAAKKAQAKQENRGSRRR